MTLTITEPGTTDGQQPNLAARVQGTATGYEEWLYQRCGIITASVVGQLITPKTVKPASNDYSRALTMHLTAERITGFVEPTFTSSDMERGNLDEPYARAAYSSTARTLLEVGFMVRDFGGYRIGYSPDGLVGDDGLIEIKSRKQKIHQAVERASTNSRPSPTERVGSRSWRDSRQVIAAVADLDPQRRRLSGEPRLELARFGRVLDRVRHQFARHEHCVPPERAIGSVAEQMAQREPRSVGRRRSVLEIENQIGGRHARGVPTPVQMSRPAECWLGQAAHACPAGSTVETGVRGER